MPESLPGMRVFFSADLAGSTKLKNRLNHQELLRRYLSRKHLVKSLRKSDEESTDVEVAAILNNLAIGTDDHDWASVVSQFYQDLCSDFSPHLPWKAMGDELIFSIAVEGREKLHQLTLAFLKAIRVLDQKLRDQRFPDAVGAIRIKGTAWVAGFPVRNREIEVPSPKETRQVDYLGPEMDTGFRLGKCTRPGMLAISVEMAELLGEGNATFAPMAAKIVGWEKLKDVWNDHVYPVIWVDFPPSLRTTEKHSAPVISEWEQAECGWCKAWAASNGQLPEVSSLHKQLVSLRSSLPASLGLVNPYIRGDDLETEEVPSTHAEIAMLLELVRTHSQTQLSVIPDVTGTLDVDVGNDLQKAESLIVQG